MERRPDRHHVRGLSFHVYYEPEEVAQLAREIRDETIADVHLSLFTYWICESNEHFERAKQHIRELGLDQGYPIARIMNATLRKLLEDTKHLRPRYELGKPQAQVHPAPEEEEGEEEGKDDPTPNPVDLTPGPPVKKSQWPRRTSSLWSPRGTRPGLSVSGLLSRASSNVQRIRAPRFSINSTARDVPRAAQSSAPLNAPSPWPMRSESAPLAMRDRIPSSAALNGSVLSPDREFPPDTPDRPAPLNLRSQGSSGTPTMSLLRSVSTPVPTQPVVRSASSPSAVWETTASRRLLPTTAENSNDTGTESETAPENIYNFSDGATDYHRDIPARAAVENNISALFRSDRPAVTEGPSMLMRNETAPKVTSSFSMNSLDSSSDTNHAVGHEGRSVFDRDGCEIDAESTNYDLVSTPQYASTSEEDHATMDTTNLPSMADTQPHYTLSSPRSRPFNFVPDDIPTPSQRRTAAQARLAARVPNASISSFNRPLPLRNYESEAFLHPALRSQGHGSPNRSNSVTMSPVRGGGRPLRIEGLNEMTRRIGPSKLRPHAAPAGIASQLSLTPSQAPTMANPENTDKSPLAEAYRSVTSAYFKEMLERTRARGAQLPSVRRMSLSPSEIAFRDANEDLIVAIYGRKDVVLSEAEVEFVGRIAKEMREGVGRISGYDWVGQLFQHE